MATTTEKMTNAKALTYILDNFRDQLPEDVLGKVTAMLNTANSKKPKTPSKDKPENVELRGKILEILSDGELHQCAEIGTLIGESTSKTSSLLGVLQDAGMVKRETVKGKAMFSLVSSAETEE